QDAIPPEPGRRVTFTGTFLKTIRYAAADQARLAPLIIGDRPPTLAAKTSTPPDEPAAAITLRALGASPVNASTSGSAQTVESWSATTWALGLVLGLAAAGVLAWQHIHKPLSRIPFSTRGRDLKPAAP